MIGQRKQGNGNPCGTEIDEVASDSTGRYRIKLGQLTGTHVMGYYLLDEAAIALKDDCLGFTLARDFDPREIGLPCDRTNGREIVGLKMDPVISVGCRICECLESRF